MREGAEWMQQDRDLLPDFSYVSVFFLFQNQALDWRFCKPTESPVLVGFNRAILVCIGPIT